MSARVAADVSFESNRPKRTQRLFAVCKIRVPASFKVNSQGQNTREEEDRGGGLASTARGAQMVPSGGLLRAKMAPAGTQMGSSNLINAGIGSTRWTRVGWWRGEKKKK